MRDELPLLELFTRLREAGLPLGLADYQAVVKALQGGYGVSDRAALERLCRTLWVRSADERQLFDHYFEQSFGIPKLEITDEEEIREILKNIIINDSQRIRQEKLLVWEVTHAIFRSFSYALLLVGLLLGVSLLGWGFWRAHQPPLAEVPDNVLNIIKTSKPTPTPTFLPSLTLQPSTQKTIRLPRTSEQSAQIEQWKRRNELIASLVNAQWQNVIILVVGAGILSSLWFLRAFLQRPPKPTNPLTPERNSKQSRKPQRKPKSQVMNIINDEVQVAQTIRQAGSLEKDVVGDRNYILTHDYFPVTRRQMKQSWRYLRQFVREGVATELDVASTVRHIAQNGMLLDPVLVPPRRNQTELILLIDQDGSMVAFHSLSARLVETASRGGRLGNAGVYYFHNCPIDYLYHDPKHQNAIALKNWEGKLSGSRSVVLIFSDAGAARGSANPARIEATKKFLAELRQQVRYVAWLNPLPKTRWEGTSAEAIAQLTPMFEISRQGLDGAISALRGKGRTGL